MLLPKPRIRQRVVSFFTRVLLSSWNSVKDKSNNWRRWDSHRLATQISIQLLNFLVHFRFFFPSNIIDRVLFYFVGLEFQRPMMWPFYVFRGGLGLKFVSATCMLVWWLKQYSQSWWQYLIYEIKKKKRWRRQAMPHFLKVVPTTQFPTVSAYSVSAKRETNILTFQFLSYVITFWSELSTIIYI